MEITASYCIIQSYIIYISGVCVWGRGRCTKTQIIDGRRQNLHGDSILFHHHEKNTLMEDRLGGGWVGCTEYMYIARVDSFMKEMGL